MTDPEHLPRPLPTDPPPDVVPPQRTRPTREVVARLLDTTTGEQITMTEHRVTEDIDGLPAGVETITTSATFIRPTLEQLGWTEAEWEDASIHE